MAQDKVIQFPTAARATSAGRLLIPSKLKEARKVARLSQGELGELIGVTRQSISAYEHGEKTPEPPVFHRLTAALKQPASYFTYPGGELFGEQRARFYRKFGPETIRRNEACATLGNWFVQVTKYLDTFVNYPAVNLPSFSPNNGATYSIEELDALALETRRTWGLGSGPLSNVLALLENKGIVVCRYELEGENVEAFSFWNGPRPFIFMASEKESGSRRRYDLAHELGHLILHRWIDQDELENKDRLREIENEANRFAGAFLLPSVSFPNEIYTTKIDAFIELKRRWKVSIQAMIYRCQDLDIIDDDRALNLYKQISFKKWRKKEPLDDPRQIPLEQPRLLAKAFELIVQSGRKHPDDMLDELRLAPSWIESFCNLPSGTFRREDAQAIEPTLK